MNEIVLVRHGETEWSAEGRHTGRTDVPLTARGERQAKAVIPLIEGREFALVLSSPLQRAVRTAEIAALPNVELDADLREWDYGDYEGLTTSEIRDRRPGWFLWRDGVPDGETLADVGARADRAISRVQQVLGNGDVAVVAHGHFLRVLGARWVRLDPSCGAHLALDTATVSVLGFEHAEPVIRLWNQAPQQS
ncbi:MAG TPA: histidine phosphatase family protein [Acidothermaceae bacterium]|nr:histidine phosphatase family protein [Acidothermaceae bacterium]